MRRLHLRTVSGIPLLGILIYGLSVFSPAHAETTNCTAITVLPAVITSQGVYCLTGNLATSMTVGNAIEIQANNVTIDLNGFKLGGLGAGDGTQANGIYAFQRKNITIKNGIVRGFFQGILLDDSSFNTINSSGHVVKHILADKNTFIGIDVAGLGNTVSHNTVVDTGSSTATTFARGIRVRGAGTQVTDNAVSATTATGTGTAMGILLDRADYSLVQNNTVTDTLRVATASRAIQSTNSVGVFFRNNNLANADFGIFFLGTTGIYKDNLTFDVGTPFNGGTDGGGNFSAT